jgi:Tol biopolymer transport system component
MLKTKAPLLATALSLVWTVASLAAATYTTVRLTDSPGCSHSASSNGNGKIVAFASDADLVPPNNDDGNVEIFLRDQKKGLTQITDTTGGSFANGEPSISKSGKRIAFLSDRDLVPPGNADGNAEIFLFDKKTGIRQVTTTIGGSNQSPKISGSGAFIAFASDRDFTGGNADASTEIYLLNVKKGTFQQITVSDRGSAAPAISNNGARIAFESSGDFNGQNADHSSEIFFSDKKKGIRQITNTPVECFAGSPAMNASGSRIAFGSDCDITGGNGAKLEQIFLFDAKKGFTQITANAAEGEDVQEPALDASGKRIAFVSNADLVPGSNPDRNYEAFLFIEKKGFVQLSHTTGGQPGVSSGPSMSSNGKRIAYELTGEESPGANADDEGEIYQVEEK